MVFELQQLLNMIRRKGKLLEIRYNILFYMINCEYLNELQD